MPDPSELAAEAALAGAAVVRERGARLGDVRAKSSAVDVVTDVDVAAGVAVVGLLRARLGDGLRVVVEEDEVYALTGTTAAPLAASDVWVVDPLDGTTSFVHGYPCYSVSVALLREGRPVAGAVCSVPADEMFTASRGGGAFLDGRRIRCSDVGERERGLLVTGFPYEREATFTRQMRIFGHLVRAAHDVRRDGSAAIDCCHVASGRCDGYWELALRPWDMAAGVLIAEEAGATVTDLAGAPWTTATQDLLVANPALHPQLLQAIRDAER